MAQKVFVYLLLFISINSYSQKVIFEKAFHTNGGQLTTIFGPTCRHQFQLDNRQNMLVVMGTSTGADSGSLVFAGQTFNNPDYSRLLKMDSAGNELWGKDIGHVANIYTDNDDNVYLWTYNDLTGANVDTALINANHDPSTAVVNTFHTNIDKYPYSIIKLDANGNFVWSKFFGLGGISHTDIIPVPSGVTNQYGNSILPLYLSAGAVLRINGTTYSNALANQNYFINIDKDGNINLSLIPVPSTCHINYLDIASDGALHYIALMNGYSNNYNTITISGIIYHNQAVNAGNPNSLFGTCDSLGNILTCTTESDANGLKKILVDKQGNTVFNAGPYSFYGTSTTWGSSSGIGTLIKMDANGGIVFDESYSDYSWGQGYYSGCLTYTFADNNDIYSELSSDNGMLIGTESIPGGNYLARINSTGRGYRWRMPDNNAGLIIYRNNKLYVSGSYTYGPIRIIADTTTIPIVPTNCSAHFSLSPDSGNTHSWTAFAQTAGNEPFTCVWNWGDGSCSTGSTPSHVYDAAGYYNICLSVFDSLGCEATYCSNSTEIQGVQQTIITVNVVNNETTGIESISSNTFSLFPNPATETLTINIGGKSAEEISIYNETGQLVDYVKAPLNNQIDIRNFPAGLYIAAINTNGIVNRQRWVKL